MAYWSNPSIHDASSIHARATVCDGFSYIEISAYGSGGNNAANIQIFMPANRAEYARHIAAAINAVAEQQPAEAPAPIPATEDDGLPF